MCMSTLYGCLCLYIIMRMTRVPPKYIKTICISLLFVKFKVLMFPVTTKLFLNFRLLYKVNYVALVSLKKKINKSFYQGCNVHIRMKKLKGFFLLNFYDYIVTLLFSIFMSFVKKMLFDSLQNFLYNRENNNRIFHRLHLAKNIIRIFYQRRINYIVAFYDN